jgi:NAD(P)H-hydrate epimerase
VVLKGAGTVIADPKKTAYVIPCGNPGMASGGTGDVLTGIIGALLAQGLNGCEAGCVGAFLHALAADHVAVETSQRGLIATDIIEALPAVLGLFEAWQDQDEAD